jgi:hypothetical protein
MINSKIRIFRIVHMQISPCVPQMIYTAFRLSIVIIANSKENTSTYVFIVVLYIQQLIWIPMYKYGCRKSAGFIKQNLNYMLLMMCFSYRVTVINYASNVL